MNSQLTKAILVIILVGLTLSCNDSKKQFTVEGTINNADTLTLYLERRGHSDVTILDSVKLSDKGSFSFKEESLGYSEFYRLRLNDKNINFSIDSTETITFTTDKTNFSTDYSVEGSNDSKQIKDVILSHLKLSKAINDLKNQHATKSITDDLFISRADSVIGGYKTKTRLMMLENFESTAAYFALFQKIEDFLIFDPSDKKDLQLFRAIATVWNNHRSASPRTKQLNDYTLSAIANAKAEANRETTLDMLMNNEIAENKEFFTISLPDINNKTISTKSLVGKIVLLDFTSYQTEYSIAHNIRLNKTYEKHKSNLEIYQISFDTDKHTWQNAATNLPWICVRDEHSAQSHLLTKFNILELPTTYILNKNGEIIKKLTVADDLISEVAKVL